VSGQATANLDRLHELLADRATQRLSPTEADELTVLLDAHPEADEDAYDLVAAALDLPAIAAEAEPLPASLRARVEIDAIAFLAHKRGLTVSADTTPAPLPDVRPTRMPWMPWLLAAACLTLAVISWWPRDAGSAAARRTQLANLPGTSTVAWASNDLGVSGDVVWNNERQEGYLRFQGLTVNDPAAFQYQLWIFDESRRDYSDDLAVDGGVFDIEAATGDVIVPIRPKLKVAEPALFAVTTEPPGGVVKHNPTRDRDRYKIILTAPL
jgi:hypothetical protein